MSDFQPIDEQRLAERLEAFRKIERELANSSPAMYWLMRSIREKQKGEEHA
jgi:hypothetical protein